MKTFFNLICEILLGILFGFVEAFTKIIINIMLAVSTSLETIAQRYSMFFCYKPNTITAKFLFYLYCAVFYIPFLAMIVSECILLSIYYVIFKFICSLPIPILINLIAIICSIIFNILNYIYYGTSILITSLPNFLLADERPLSYSEIVNL